MKEVRKVDGFTHLHTCTSIRAAATTMPAHAVFIVHFILLITSDVFCAASFEDTKKEYLGNLSAVHTIGALSYGPERLNYLF